MGNAQVSRLRRVAIYGRVSTEHEAQLSAFENQQAWYEGVALQHQDWIIVERYYDEGITGTAAQKRPAFMRMLKDARQHRFDLVVTREVCRFARNTVDRRGAPPDHYGHPCSRGKPKNIGACSCGSANQQGERGPLWYWKYPGV